MTSTSENYRTFQLSISQFQLQLQDCIKFGIKPEELKLNKWPLKSRNSLEFDSSLTVHKKTHHMWILQIFFKTFSLVTFQPNCHKLHVLLIPVYFFT